MIARRTFLSILPLTPLATLERFSGNIGTVTAGTVSGSNVTIDLDAAGTSNVMSWPGGAFTAAGNFALGSILTGGGGLVWDQGAGALTVSGTIDSSSTVAASTFTASSIVVDGDIEIKTGQSNWRVRLRNDGAGNGHIQLRESSETGAGSIVMLGGGTQSMQVACTGDLFLQNGQAVTLQSSAGGEIGFFGRTPVTKPSAGNLAELLTALDNLGLVNDTS